MNRIERIKKTIDDLTEDYLRRNNREHAQAWLYDTVIKQAIGDLKVQNIAYDLVGVQPMTGPAGQIFTFRARYDSNKN